MALLVNLRDAAEMLGCSERTVRRLQDRGELPISMLGSARRVPVAALERLARTGTKFRGSVRQDLPRNGNAATPAKKAAATAVAKRRSA